MPGPPDVSQNLDILGQVPGDMLGRDETTWARIAGGPAGNSLVSNGPDKLPSWQPLGGGAGGQVMTNLSELAVSGSAHASKGMYFDPTIALTISGGLVRFDATSGASYKLMLVRLTGTTLAEVLAESSVLSGFATGTRREPFDFGGTVGLTPGTEYALVHVRTDSTPTTASGAWVTGTLIPVGPWSPAFGFVFMDTIAPAVSDTFTKTEQSQVFVINFLYRA